MSGGGSVSHWIGDLKEGEHAAAQPLWERYFQRLVALARAKLAGASRQAADEEDVALSAFDSFCRGVDRGRYPQLIDREDLWHVLVTITAHKALDQIRSERRQKRRGAAAESVGIEQLVGREPTPEFAAQVADQCRQLLKGLDDADLLTVALWKMEGYTTNEIAAKMGYVPRTIERKLRLIRDIWTKMSIL
jgi:DNA-directed RNA polymerase specialized sigma24 family protein